MENQEIVEAVRAMLEQQLSRIEALELDNQRLKERVSSLVKERNLAMARVNDIKDKRTKQIDREELLGMTTPQLLEWLDNDGASWTINK